MSAPQHCYLRMHHDSIFHCCGPGLRFKKLPKQIRLDFHVQYLLTESYIGFFVNCSLFNDKYSSYFHMTFYLRKCHFLIFFWLTNKFELVSRPLTVGIYLSVAMNCGLNAQWSSSHFVEITSNIVVSNHVPVSIYLKKVTEHDLLPICLLSLLTGCSSSRMVIISTVVNRVFILTSLNSDLKKG